MANEFRDFSTALSFLLVRDGMNAHNLAKGIGMASSTIHRLLESKERTCSDETLDKICGYFMLSQDDANHLSALMMKRVVAQVRRRKKHAQEAGSVAPEKVTPTLVVVKKPNDIDRVIQEKDRIELEYAKTRAEFLTLKVQNRTLEEEAEKLRLENIGMRRQLQKFSEQDPLGPALVRFIRSFTQREKYKGG